ncbi:FecR family protein [Spirosoma endophyticum]|uniref:FecR family protein n=1 Tax=Spirosoma endophyticum TaxID=662367 RepID=A0A1I1T495_9BACT|nr:FecR family protein [Spirosoma endophyticum]SFD53372.1 FecR family protein [Spirosoma endophyticum]
MNQYDFDKLIEKYLAGQSSPEEESLIREWADNKLAKSNLSLSQPEEQAIKKRIWTSIHRNALGQQPFIIRHGWLRISAVAASVLLALLTGVYLWKQPIEKRSELAIAGRRMELRGTINVKNTSEKPQKITLKDGSYVVLKAQSTISYPEHFGEKTRQVYLQGEAFFDVKKDPVRPFIVHTGNLVTQVLGTSFTVKSYDEAKTIEVLVTRGRVSVYEDSEKSSQERNGVILIPNQKITFDKASQKLIPSLVETPSLVQPPETRTSFVFDRAPLDQVLTTLRKAYGIEFVVESPSLSHCVFNGDLNDLPLYVQLDLVCKSINARYERRGTTLFIAGEGCPD